ncbi:DNA polymerase III subunit delta [Alteromonas sediminis]|uniref:DNA polymerase III subunit delta n=1 Tax=Alteromonas sediminis TaxID=2259342 RepID=A0A3N5YFG2_9ALTE|nr:DNA polymerase III subunit delta [Alteromonas sediminis]RPJ68785.1 DNA polymerase III subunit delta [Alteromonas sediminis]
MQLYPNRLDADLAKHLVPFYLVFGDEPQQKLSAVEAIRNTARASGFDERTVLVQDAEFEWQHLYDATQSMSLFSAKQLIELELPTGKPGKEGAKALELIAEQANPDTLLIVHGPRIGKDVQRTKWFKALDTNGRYIPCYPLEGKQLLQWLEQTARNTNLTMTPQAASLLAEYCEGNMLAGAQEIEKLALVYADQTINETHIEEAVVNQSRYNVFQLIDTMLAGDGAKMTRLLLSLESEGLEPNIIIWALIREWQTLTEIKHIAGPVNWQSYRIWGPRQGYYQQALNRLSGEHLVDIGKLLQQADHVFKQQTVVRPFVALNHLCLVFVTPALLQLPWCE